MYMTIYGTVLGRGADEAYDCFDSGYLLPISLRREWARLILIMRTMFCCRS